MAEVRDPLCIMREIHRKSKQGFKISNMQEFLSLIELCSSQDGSIRISACKYVKYLLDWKLVELPSTITLLNSSFFKTKDVDGIFALTLCAISDLSKSGNDVLFKDTVKTFVQTVRNVISVNPDSVVIILSLLGQIDINFVISHLRHIVYELVFGEHPYRSLTWRVFSGTVDLDMHRTFLLSLKFSRMEDLGFLLTSLEKIQISRKEKCLHLIAAVHNMLCCGFNPREAIRMLFENIAQADAHTHSLALLTICSSIDSYSSLYIFVVLELCEWFLRHCIVWKEVLLTLVACLLPLTMKSTVTNNYQIQAKQLVISIQQKASSENSINSESLKCNSLFLKSIIYRHDCLHKAHLMLRLLTNHCNDSNLMEWLQGLLNSSLMPKFNETQLILGNYFLTKPPDIRRLCLSIFNKWKVDNIYLYIFQLSREDDPKIILELLRILSTKTMPDGNKCIFDLLKSLSNKELDSCFVVEIDLLRKCNLQEVNIDNLLPKLLIIEKDFCRIVSQSVLIKAIAHDLNIHLELTIPFCNNIINSNKAIRGSVVTSLIIDALSEMCVKHNLDVSVLWNSLLPIVAGEKHPSIQKSVCYFLSKVPSMLKHSNNDPGILYKSARVLWHFVQNDIQRELSIRCLKEYKLDIFDSTFLSNDCKSHTKIPADDIQDFNIKGDCWMHMINNISLAELFSHYINKESEDARFRGSYMNLFNSIINFLRNCELDAIQQILVCLKMLSAKWKRIPSAEDMNCLMRFYKHNSQQVKESVLLVISNFALSNESAKFMFFSIIEQKQLSEREKAVLCFLPGILLDIPRYNVLKETLLFEGLCYGFSPEFTDLQTGKELRFDIQEAVLLDIKNSSIRPEIRRTLMKTLINIWCKIPIENKVFETVSMLLSDAYGYQLVKSLVHEFSSEDMSRKIVYLSRLVVIKTNSLYCFDTAISIGNKNKSLQQYIVENFIQILPCLGEKKRSNNTKWLLRILCSSAINTNDFMCTILVYGFNFITGTSVLSSSASFCESLDHFPLALSEISKSSGKGNYIILTMNELLNKTEKIHPCFIEVFRYTVLRIRDEAFISYDMVVKRTIA